MVQAPAASPGGNVVGSIVQEVPLLASAVPLLVHVKVLLYG